MEFVPSISSSIEVCVQYLLPMRDPIEHRTNSVLPWLLSNAFVRGVFKYVLFWSTVVPIFRWIFAHHRSRAASCVSLTFCVWTVAWGGAMLYLAAPWPMGAFEFDMYALHAQAVAATRVLPAKGPVLQLVCQRIITIQSVDQYLYFAFTYLTTDMVYDYDIRFVLHHILTATAVATTYFMPHLHGSFILTAFIAEMGGIVFHVSKLVQRQWMELVFLVVYTISRVILFPLLVVWLLYSLWYHPSSVLFKTLVNIWATGGTTILIGINIDWARKQWIRYRRKYVQSKGPVAFSVMYLPKSSKSHHRRNRRPPVAARQRVYVYAPDSVVESSTPQRQSKTAAEFVSDGIGFAWDILS